MKKRIVLCNAVILAMMTSGANNVFAQESDRPNATTTTTVTNATGTISQVNYDETGAVDGFLLGTNIFLSFPTNVCGGIGSLGAAGNGVTYSGASRTNSTTSFESVIVSSFTNTTTHATYTQPTTRPTPTAYGPTSGSVTRLNYDPSGAINGFLFTPSSTTATIPAGPSLTTVTGVVLVVFGPGASSTLKPLLTVGGTVSVTGRTIPEAPACAATGNLTVINASSLIINGQTIVISGHGNF
jgi:hypothetical protein